MQRVDLRPQPVPIPADTDAVPTLDLPIEVVDLADMPDETWLRHKGTVQVRAEVFVERHRRLPTEAECLRGVTDLADDAELAARMAVAYEAAARARWERWRWDPHDWLRRS